MKQALAPPFAGRFTSTQRPPNKQARPLGIRAQDALAVLVIVALSVVAEWDRLTGPGWLGMDTATAFYPWYAFLGEQLRAGHLPVWNPHQFSGAPFAADPEAGWAYLPAMVAFAALPLDAAARAHLLFNVLLAGVSTYALARVLGSNATGGVLAAMIYAHSGFLEGHNVCCYAYADVAAWLPLTLLGAEFALRGGQLLQRLLWWGVSGLAFSQIISAWVGQGAYYAGLVLAAFVVCRRARPIRIATTGVGIAVFGLALGAAGLLPRLEYNLVSNLPGGYPSVDVSLRATSWSDWGLIDHWDRLLLQPGFEYIGWPALVLSVVAPLIAWRRRGVWFFAGLGLAVLVLARAEPTPLHAALSLLPGFERIHARSPERAMIVFYLAPALLSAATLTVLSGRIRWLAVSRVIGLMVVAVVAFDLHQGWLAQSAESLAGGDDTFQRVDLDGYFASTPAARFLMSQPGSFRYFGYAGHVFGGPMPYTLRWADPSITALEVNNRGLIDGIEDIQGYNPVHIARYDDFMAAVNGHPQNYHHTDVFDSGLDSPLLDLLNVRYILAPVTPAADEVMPSFQRQLVQVYADQTVQIFENASAMGDAWLVHFAVQLAPDDVPLALADPSRDLRRVALLEATPPPMSAPAVPSAESVEVLERAPDRLTVRATASAPALLVLSEVYYPAWHAYLDGQPVPVYAVDRALRGVAVPAGGHTIDMRYESPALAVGLLASTLAFAVLVGLAILHFANRSGDGSGEVRCKAGAVPQL